ncbi:MAG: hypothetical protein ACOX12_07675 [Eggerthellaceae bacterium]
MIDGAAYEIKTPRSLSKIGRLTKDASLKEYGSKVGGNGTKNLLMSLLNIGDENESTVHENVDSFIQHGDLDTLEVIGV